jgi:hypothetical protein
MLGLLKHHAYKKGRVEEKRKGQQELANLLISQEALRMSVCPVTVQHLRRCRTTCSKWQFLSGSIDKLQGTGPWRYAIANTFHPRHCAEE